RAASSPSPGQTRVDQNRRAMALPPCGTQHTPACPPSPPLRRPGVPRPSPRSVDTGYVQYGTDRIWGTISCLRPSPFSPKAAMEDPMPACYVIEDGTSDALPLYVVRVETTTGEPLYLQLHASDDAEAKQKAQRKTLLPKGIRVRTVQAVEKVAA